MARDKTKRMAAHPNPQGRAEELINTWAWASSSESLPAQVKEHLSAGERAREEQVQLATTYTDHTDTPITERELWNAKKTGSSTAPGDDGITYDIIEALMYVRGNPLLQLLNKSYCHGKLPSYWKEATIIPIPKPHQDDFRPISLTSCL